MGITFAESIPDGQMLADLMIQPYVLWELSNEPTVFYSKVNVTNLPNPVNAAN